jgi:hypothetical protein
MFNPEWQDFLHEIAGNVRNSNEFQEFLLQRYQAHGCNIAYSRFDQSTVNVGTHGIFKSYLTDDDLKHYLVNLFKKRIFYSKINERHVCALNELWLNVGSKFPEVSSNIRAIVAGVCQDTFKDLQYRKGIIATKWLSEIQNLEIELQDKITTYTAYRSSFESLEEERFINLADSCEQSDWLLCDIDEDELIVQIVDSSAFHIFGSLPISFVSIGVPFRARPDATCDFITIVLFWCGMPVGINSTEMMELVSIVNDISPRISFPVEQETSFAWAKDLARLVCSRQSIVHTYEQWLHGYRDFLRQYASPLYSRENSIDSHSLSTAKSWYYFQGLKWFNHIPQSSISGFNLDVLFLVAHLHCLVLHQTNTVVKANRKNYVIRNTKFNYFKWSEFLRFLSQGESEHGDTVIGVEITNTQLRIFVNESSTVSKLGRKFHDFLRFPGINCHQTIGSLYESIITPNLSEPIAPATTDCPSPSDRLTPTLKIEFAIKDFQVSYGNNSTAEVKLRFDETKKAIILSACTPKKPKKSPNV